MSKLLNGLLERGQLNKDEDETEYVIIADPGTAMIQDEELMTQKDYILRLAEDVGRLLAKIIYQRETRDYQGALTFIDEQFKQIVGMGSGFIHSVPEETLLSMLTTFGKLNIDKVIIVATLLKAEGDVYSDQDNSADAYYRYLKSLNLYLAVLLQDHDLHNVGSVPEVEDILNRLEEYELPATTKRLLIRYYEQIGNHLRAEEFKL